jgi:predicted amidophosphoribosyltransferase
MRTERACRRDEPAHRLFLTRMRQQRRFLACKALGRIDAQIRLVSGRYVIVVDDVITSGSTMRECQRVLFEAGARDVRGVVLARTVGWRERFD